MSDNPSPPPAPEQDPAVNGASAVSEHFVVGVGASAGGLDAIRELLKQLPAPSGLAIVVVQHLDPTHESHLVDLLSRASHLPVQWAVHGGTVELEHVYVVPPRTRVTLRNRTILFAASEGRGGYEIDHLFRSLADDVKDCAVGVLLSGHGRDGVAGLRAIKAAGGYAFVQEPATAAAPEMPRAAIEARCADRVLSPTGIAKELLKLTHDTHRLLTGGSTHTAGEGGAGEAEQLAMIFQLLTARTGVDFSHYKQSTIKRRLVRRMMVVQVAELRDYVALLKKDRNEVRELFDTLLIHVTEFFRDPECFEFLQDQVLPRIIDHHQDNSPIRVWVPGCSTGEEVYSLGIAIRELLDQRGRLVPVQIFGTDISERVVAFARAAHYTAADVANVSAERLQRYFVKTDHGYAVQKQVRDMCVFARQNVVRDSPFSRIDLISCRNVLIYLGPAVQRKLMPVFHYALKPNGYLLLGNSESVGGNADLFRLIDRHVRVYSRKSTNRRTHIEVAPDLRLPVFGAATTTPPVSPADDMKEPFDIIREADRIVLNRLAPGGVVVNEDLEVVQFRGDVAPYLTPLSGRATLNLLKMARDGLAAELQAAIQKARAENVRVQVPGVRVLHEHGTRVVNLDVTPVESVRTKERFYLVLFQSPPPAAAESARSAGVSAPADAVELAHIEQLRHELQATRNYLQATIEKHEATNQELRAANEEIQSSNEELQSTNEELETAKEELQSTNEELTTVNEELHNRQLDLIQLNNDLHNLINSVHLPIVILGPDLRIRRFTPMAERVLNIIPTDIGRPLSDINIGLQIEDLPRLIAVVIDTLEIKEIEVQGSGGRWFSLRLRPYKTADNKIDGVVLTLIDIDAMKRTLAEAEEARDFAQAVIETTREPLAALTPDLRIKTANDAFYEMFGTTRERAEGRLLFDVIPAPEKVGELRRKLEGILPRSTSLTNQVISIDLPEAGPTSLVINVRQIARGSRAYPLILLAVRTP